MLPISSFSRTAATTPSPQATRSHGARVAGPEAVRGVADALERVAAAMSQDPMALTASPARRKRAWEECARADADELDDDEYSACVTVFSSTTLADEYMRFPAKRQAARRKWLRAAIDEKLARQPVDI
jgi:hypothetical protein